MNNNDIVVHRKVRWFYGWNIVGVGFFSQMFAVGLSSGSFSVFVLPLQEELNTSRFAINLVHSFLFLGMVILAPFVQFIISKTSLKSCLLIGIGSLCTGLVLMSFANNVNQVVLIYATLIAAGTTFAGTIPSSTLVVNWFSRLRGRAMGISTAGASMGSFLAPPVAAFLIVYAGWRDTYMALGVICAVILLPAIWLVIVARPEDVGLHADGDASAAEENSKSTDASLALSALEILSHRAYWIVAILTGFGITIQKGVLVNLVPLAVESGYQTMSGAYLVSALTACMIVGKIFIGAAADRVKSSLLFFVALFLCALGVGVIALSANYTMMLCGSILMGVGSGGFFPLLGIIIGENFPRAMFAKVMGLLMPAIYLITIPGAPIAGYLYDQTGSYSLALWVFAIGLLLAAVGALAVRKKY